MPAKTTAKTPDGASPLQEACNPPAGAMQRVRITAHGTEAAGLICSAGAIITVPADTAAALVADGKACRIY